METLDFYSGPELQTLLDRGYEVVNYLTSPEVLTGTKNPRTERGVVSYDVSVTPLDQMFMAVLIRCEGGTLVSINCFDQRVIRASVSPRLVGEFGKADTYKPDTDAVKTDVVRLLGDETPE
jgi:hypothetical protein